MCLRICMHGVPTSRRHQAGKAWSGWSLRGRQDPSKHVAHADSFLKARMQQCSSWQLAFLPKTSLCFVRHGFAVVSAWIRACRSRQRCISAYYDSDSLTQGKSCRTQCEHAMTCYGIAAPQQAPQSLSVSIPWTLPVSRGMPLYQYVFRSLPLYRRPFRMPTTDLQAVDKTRFCLFTSPLMCLFMRFSSTGLYVCV